MKTRSLIFSSLAIFLFAAIGFAQQPRPERRTGSSTSTTMSARVPIPAAIDFDIKEQADSPLRLLIEPMPAGRLMPGSPITVRNDGGSTIAAFVLRVDVEPMGMNKLVIVGPKGLGFGQKLLQSMAIIASTKRRVRQSCL